MKKAKPITVRTAGAEPALKPGRKPVLSNDNKARTAGARAAPKDGTHSPDQWPPELVKELRALWLGRPENKMTGSKIATRLERTKNQILGKLNRLGLLAPKPRARHLSSTAAAVMALRVEQCRYPYGDVGAPNFAFCDADAMSESPYCPQHHRACYLNPKISEALAAGWTEERKAEARRRMAYRKGST